MTWVLKFVSESTVYSLSRAPYQAFKRVFGWRTCVFFDAMKCVEKQVVVLALLACFFACEEAFLSSNAVKLTSISFYNAFRACQKAKHTRNSNNIQGNFMPNFSSVFLIHICSPDRLKSMWLVQRHVNSNLEKWKFAQRSMRCAEWAHFFRALRVWSKTAKTHENMMWRDFYCIYFEFRGWPGRFKRDSRVLAYFFYSKWYWHVFLRSSQCREIGHVSSKSLKSCSGSCWTRQTCSQTLFLIESVASMLPKHLFRLESAFARKNHTGTIVPRKQASTMLFSDTEMHSNMGSSM